MIKKRRLLYGRKFIREYLNCGKKDKIVTNRFNISPGSFFQTNPRQAEVLYNNIIQLANLKGREIVFDLYSGTGTIAIILAQFARRIYAIEEERESVVDAKQNAKMNKARNVTFLKGDALSEARKLAKRKIYPDLAVIDPPRSGLSENAMRKLLEIIPPRIIYVSCNPRTLVRDLEVLQMNKFKVLSVQPIDMFPQTSHVEVMVDLEWEGQVTSGK